MSGDVGSGEEALTLAVPPGWKRLLLNLLIGLLLFAMLVQSIPGLDMLGGDVVEKVTQLTGTWQNHWSMFAPNPDRSNHRIELDITYQNGKEVVWNSPDWPKLSTMERFLTVRMVKWFDNLPETEPARRSFARYIAEKNRVSPATEDRPRSVRIVVKSHRFENPTGSRWPNRHEPFVFDDQYVLPKIKYR